MVDALPMTLPGLSRRDLLVFGTAALAGTFALAGCAAAAGEALFNPAVDGWLASLGAAVGANLISDGVEKGLTGFFASWSKPTSDTIYAQSSTTEYTAYYTDLITHEVPPTAIGGGLPQVADRGSNDRSDGCMCRNWQEGRRI